ncbi:hypothetical protein Aoki45_13370 [Algoriphagus sp. oki45]|nr:hypothetical protein Aoki45_13370 [Algoriphagus sp. oki45]
MYLEVESSTKINSLFGLLFLLQLYANTLLKIPVNEVKILSCAIQNLK